MKIPKLLRMIATLVMMAGLLAACSSTPASQPAAPAPSQPAQPAPAAPAAQPAAPAAPTPFRLGVMPIADCIQAFIADDQGYFKEQGLEVTMQFMRGGAEIAPAVAGGSLDAGWSNMVSVSLAHARGIDFVFFTPGALETPNNRVHRILVNKDSGLTSLKDLEGKTAAVNTLDNIPYVAFATSLQKAGADLQKVSFVEVPFPNMLAALGEGKVDAAIVPEPFATVGLSGGAVTELDAAPFAALGDRTFVASWFASDKWLQANADVAKRFVTALNKANQFFVQNPTEGRKILLKYTQLSDELASQIILPAFEGDIKTADLQPVIEAATQLGLLQKSFPAQEIIRTGF